MQIAGLTTGLSPGIGLYIHIPFCETKCPYCDFNTYERIEGLMPQYIEALIHEIDLWGETLRHPRVNTLFLGGGTPSYLPSNQITPILEVVRSEFHVEADAEITLEANPGDFSLESLRRYLELGINRISIGFQSLKDELLQLLGRRHSAHEAIEAYRLARKAGFANVNIDLMYGIPYQGLADWGDTLRRTLSLEPDHLSLYCLTLEEGTPMARWVSSGKMPEPDADLAADMYLLAEEMLSDSGFLHYEISNWARPGYESRHNLTYWRNLPYLGVGPGAHSYLAGNRFYNLRSPREYIKRLGKLEGKRPQASSGVVTETVQAVPVVEKVEDIDQGLEIAETLMMGLRLDEGIELQGFSKRFGVELGDVFGSEIKELTSLGLVAIDNGALHLTPRGRLLGNEVFQRFVAKEACAKKTPEPRRLLSASFSKPKTRFLKLLVK